VGEGRGVRAVRVLAGGCGSGGEVGDGINIKKHRSL